MAIETRVNAADQDDKSSRRPGEEELDLARSGEEPPEKDKWEDDSAEIAIPEDQLSNPNIHYGSHTAADPRAAEDDQSSKPIALGDAAIHDDFQVPNYARPATSTDAERFGSGKEPKSFLKDTADWEILPSSPQAVGHGRAVLHRDEKDGDEDPQPTPGPNTGDTEEIPSAAHTIYRVDDDRVGENSLAPSIADDAVISAADVSGNEDSAIALDLSAALSDLDGSETLAVTISGVPDGASFNHGSHQGGGVWSLDPTELGDLTITPPANSDADFTLTLNATTTDGADTATISQSFEVTVDPIADDAIETEANVIYGSNGKDELHGTEDDDILYGGNGKDKLYGEGGDDVLYGENGKDELYGGDGNDTLYGGNGKDTLYGNDGDDVLYLDSDNDTAFGGDGNDHFMFGFGDGTNEVNGGTGNTWIDVIELEGISSPPGGGDWTLQIEEGSVEVSAADHLVLSEDSTGTITLSDGSAIDFEGIERIEW